MVFLAAAVFLFAVLHLVPALPRLKAMARARLGAAFGPAFGAASIFALGLVIAAKKMAGYEELYVPPAWGWYAALVLLFVASCCLSVFLFRGSLRVKLRFPLALAAIFWGVGHLCANGDLAGVILFGGMALYGAAHFILASINGVRPALVLRGGHDLLSIMMGAAIFGVLTQLHPAIIGVPVLVLTR